jgi:hypothetical protein
VALQATAAGCLLALSNLAQAEVTPAGAEVKADSHFGQYLASPDYADALRNLAARWDKALQVKCEEATTVDPKGRLSVLKAVDAPQAGKPPVSGTWQQRFTVKRCGQTQVYNAFINAAPDLAPHVGALLPGLSTVDPILARDAANNLAQVAKAKEYYTRGGKQCLDFAVTDTKVVTPPKGTGPSRFEEAWSVRYCGKVTPWPMCFTPKADGTMSFVSLSCADADKKAAADAAAEAASAASAASGASAPAKPAAAGSKT